MTTETGTGPTSRENTIRAILQALKDKGFGPMTTTELRPAELIDAVSRTVGGPHGTGRYSADGVIQIVKDILLEPVPGPKTCNELTIVNGPQHSEKFDTVEGDGVTLSIPAVPQLRRHPEEADIRYAHPTYMNQYFILGDFAYYIGQCIVATGALGMPHLDAEDI